MKRNYAYNNMHARYLPNTHYPKLTSSHLAPSIADIVYLQMFVQQTNCYILCSFLKLTTECS